MITTMFNVEYELLAICLLLWRAHAVLETRQTKCLDFNLFAVGWKEYKFVMVVSAVADMYRIQTVT